MGTIIHSLWVLLLVFSCFSDPLIRKSDGQRVLRKTLWDHLKAEKSLSWFYKVAKKIHMRNILETRQMTIFAPTNAAYEKLSKKVQYRLRFNLNKLYYVVLYHFIIDGDYPTPAMVDGMMLPVGLDKRAFLNVRRNSKGGRDVWIQGMKLIKRDIKARNGILHIIDGVMLPPERGLIPLMDTDSDSDIMKSLVSKANFVLPTGYTVFTPHDDAFDELSPKGLTFLRKSGRATRVFVAQHIVPRPIFMSALMPNRPLGVKTLAGSIIMLSSTPEGTVISLPGTTKRHMIEVDKSDLMVTNGVVHSVKHVLTTDESLFKVKNTQPPLLVVTRAFPDKKITFRVTPEQGELQRITQKITTQKMKTKEATTLPPTTIELTTLPPTTMEVTTLPLTTKEQTTLPPTTKEPTNLSQTTMEPTTLPPTTIEPTTLPSTTMEPTTLPPTTKEPSTLPPTTMEPTTLPPTTKEPTTLPPTTKEPTTLPPTTMEPTTLPPTTKEPTTLPPTTKEPTTLPPTTMESTTLPPTTKEPTTLPPTTKEPTTLPPTTMESTTLPSTTKEPTTLPPTTKEPTTLPPTTKEPTTLPPTTMEPTTLPPTTMEPTTLPPTTKEPTTLPPTTMEPTTLPPTTKEPITLPPTTMEPTTLPPTTKEPTTLPPTTMEPTTLPPTTKEPTTLPPTTMEPTTLPPTTKEPTTLPPTTMEPTTLPPTTKEPTTLPPTTKEPTTLPPTTKEPTTLPPTTKEPTTLPPTTKEPTTLPPTTKEPTTLPPTTKEPTTLPPTTKEPTTLPPTTKEPTTLPPTTKEPTTLPPTTKEPTTLPPTTKEPTTLPPTTKEPTTLPQTTILPTARAACYRNEIPFCMNIFNNTVFPNSFKHRSQPEAWQQIKEFIPLAKTRCAKHIRHYLCSLYTPPCTPGKDIAIVRPCRSLCATVRDSCIGLLKDPKLASVFDCSALPGELDANCYEPTMNLRATLINRGLTQFLKHVMEFDDLRPILISNENKHTIFAARDEAFAKLNGISKSFANNRNYRKQIIQYHIIPNDVKTKDIRFREFTAMSGHPLIVRAYEKRRIADEAFILLHDKAATNGRLNIIDRLMIPNENHIANVLSIQEKPSITLFRRALNMVGIFDSLKKKIATRYIVWVPTDDAFLKLSQKTLQYIFTNPEALRSIVDFHLTPGYFHTKLMTTRWVYVFRTRIRGVRLRVRKINQGPTGLLVYNNAKRTARSVVLNIGATNGMVNLIDTVLFPPNLKIPAYAQF